MTQYVVSTKTSREVCDTFAAAIRVSQHITATRGIVPVITGRRV